MASRHTASVFASISASRQSEVHHDRFTKAVDHHVRRLQVAMNDAGLVSCLQGGCQLVNDRQSLTDRQQFIGPQQL